MGRVELDKFEFTSLKLGHHEKKVEIYVLYERIFCPKFSKNRFFSPKIGQKMVFFVVFQSRRMAREICLVYKARVHSESTIFTPKFCTWLELEDGGGRDPTTPLDTRMNQQKHVVLVFFKRHIKCLNVSYK